MSGTVIRAGHYMPGATSGFATVYSANQRAFASDLSPSAGTVIWYRMGGRVGRYGGSPAIFRWGVMDTTSGQKPNGQTGRVPRNRVAQTHESSTNAPYTGGGEGETVFINLTSPFASSSREWAFAATCRSGILSQGMTPASGLGGSHNTGFYDRTIPSGTTVIHNGYSNVSNQGHEAIWMEGESNVAPTAPTSMSPSGNISSRTPAIAGNFNDANKTLNNGVAWDRPESAQIQVRRVSGSVMMWDHTYTTSSTERSNQRTSRTYAGSPLLYETTYQFRIRHRDRAGAWGAWSGWQSFVIKYNNRKPNNPSSFTGHGTHHGTKSLAVGANFTDPDLPTLPDGQAYERFEYKQVRVRRQSDNVLVYNPGAVATTASEKNNKRSYTTYTLPAYNVSYRWEERHRDRFGAWSNWHAVTAIAYSGGSAERPSSPSGRVTNLSNPGNITAVYRNSGGLSANRVRAALYTSTGTLIKSGEMAVSVAPNGTISIPWSVLGVTLDPATTYGVGVRPRDSSGTWATDMSPLATITTNAPPTIPTLYGPTNGQARSTIPTLSVRSNDPDQANSGTLVTIEIYDEDNNLLGSDTADFNGSAGSDVYSLPPGDVSTIISGAYGTYHWRAKADDGYLETSWSPLWTFTYAAVPTVTITEPDGPIITTSQPTFTWTCPNQTHWRLRGYDNGTVVFDTGEVAGGSQLYILPSDANWIGTERWNNHESFDWVVSVRDTSTLWGSSNLLPLTLEYIVPDPLIVEGVAGVLPGVKGTHYAVLNHTQTTYVQDEFIAYVWSRVEIDGPAGDEVPGTYIAEFARNTNGGNLTLADFDLTSNQWYRWGVRQEVQQGVDIIASDSVYVELMVSFQGTLLHMPFDPLSNYVWLQYGRVGEEYEPSREYGMSVTRETDLNGDVHNYIMGKPTVSPSGEYTFMTSRASESPTAMQQLDTLYRMFVYQNPKFSPDGRPHGLCWREGRGGLSGRQYVMLVNWRDTTTMDGTQSVDLEFIPNVNGGGQ